MTVVVSKNSVIYWLWQLLLLNCLKCSFFLVHFCVEMNVCCCCCWIITAFSSSKKVVFCRLFNGKICFFIDLLSKELVHFLCCTHLLVVLIHLLVVWSTLKLKQLICYFERQSLKFCPFFSNFAVLEWRYDVVV